jgi:nitroreductase
MLLSARALGLGSCWIGAYGSAYEGMAKDILAIPGRKRLLSLISLGYPSESPIETRKGLGEIVFHDKYGQK